MDKLPSVRGLIEDRMDEILEHFKPDRRIAVLVWHPWNPDEDLLLTNEPSIDAIIAMLERSKTREAKD